MSDSDKTTIYVSERCDYAYDSDGSQCVLIRGHYPKEAHLRDKSRPSREQYRENNYIDAMVFRDFSRSPDLYDLEYLEERYTAEVVPSCRVCGGRLGIARMGGGCSTEYACTSEDARKSVFNWKSGTDESHYRRSKWTEHRRGDSDVLWLIDALRREMNANN